ncbi:MAG: START-like domain-containing protein [Saprospiraceae bacterium]
MKRVSFTLEFILKTSPTIVYKFLTTPSCLIRWFCDAVEIDGDKFIYYWDGEEEVAFLIDDFEDEYLRFRWEEAESNKEFLEFKMSISDVTRETVFEIVDYCDEDEVEDQKQLWTNQIDAMKKAMGVV